MTRNPDVGLGVVGMKTDRSSDADDSPSVSVRCVVTRAHHPRAGPRVFQQHHALETAGRPLKRLDHLFDRTVHATDERQAQDQRVHRVQNPASDEVRPDQPQQKDDGQRQDEVGERGDGLQPPQAVEIVQRREYGPDERRAGSAQQIEQKRDQQIRRHQRDEDQEPGQKTCCV